MDSPELGVLRVTSQVWQIDLHLPTPIGNSAVSGPLHLPSRFSTPRVPRGPGAELSTKEAPVKQLIRIRRPHVLGRARAARVPSKPRARRRGVEARAPLFGVRSGFWCTETADKKHASWVSAEMALRVGSGSVL